MSQPSDLNQVVGVRFEPSGALVWLRAGDVPAAPGDWVVAEQGGQERPGVVVVGRGQCLALPASLTSLPTLLRVARPDERPPFESTAGGRLLREIGLGGA